jgi:hypothetical protein
VALLPAGRLHITQWDHCARLAAQLVFSLLSFAYATVELAPTASTP